MLTLKLISEETERVIKGLEKKHFPNAREAVEKVWSTTRSVVKPSRSWTPTSSKPTSLPSRLVL